MNLRKKNPKTNTNKFVKLKLVRISSKMSKCSGLCAQKEWLCP